MLAVRVISDAYSNRIRLTHQAGGTRPETNGSNKKSDPGVALFHGSKRAIIRRSLRPLQ